MNFETHAARALPLILATLLALAGCSSSSPGTSRSSSGSGAAVSSSASPVPEIAAWESAMRSFGRIHCDLLQGGGDFDTKLAATYYDAEWVYYQIAEYLGEPEWHACAEAAEKIYRDRYVLANSGAIPGYWIFSHGLAQDFLRSGDQRSRQALAQLASNAAFASDGTALSETVSADLSREVAYIIMAYINAEHVGEPFRPRLDAMVEQAFGHMDQWFVSKSAPYVRPFMVALTAQALIAHFDRTGDVRVKPALTRAADYLWDRAWLPASQAFMYTDRSHSSGGQEPAPDLNLLIAPMYGWLYYQTGEARFAERGDQIFAGGARGAFLSNPKQFNQNYRWSFEYVRLRSIPPVR